MSTFFFFFNDYYYKKMVLVKKVLEKKSWVTTKGEKCTTVFERLCWQLVHFKNIISQFKNVSSYHLGS